MKEAIKQMVKALETEAEIYNDHDPEDGPPEYIVEALKVGRQAIANAEPQASPWKEYWLDIVKENNDLHERIAEAEKHEPVAIVVASQYEDGSHAGNHLEWRGRNEANDFPEGTAFYTHPQPKAEQDVVSGKTFDQFVALNEANAARVLELEAMLEAAKAEKQEPVASGLAQKVIGCFRAAEIEGLTEALAETTDERLKDLVQRRLMHALYAAESHPGQKREPLTDEQIDEIIKASPKMDTGYAGWVRDQRRAWARAIEAAHGIKE